MYYGFYREKTQGLTVYRSLHLLEQGQVPQRSRMPSRIEKGQVPSISFSHQAPGHRERITQPLSSLASSPGFMSTRTGLFSHIDHYPFGHWAQEHKDKIIRPPSS